MALSTDPRHFSLELPPPREFEIDLFGVGVLLVNGDSEAGGQTLQRGILAME
jgi:hypothetical protein